jgi:hypothetical protein
MQSASEMMTFEIQLAMLAVQALFCLVSAGNLALMVWMAGRRLACAARTGAGAAGPERRQMDRRGGAGPQAVDVHRE